MKSAAAMQEAVKQIRRLAGLSRAVLQEIFDERAWQRFVERSSKPGATFSDFLRERHGRPRQRCC